MAHEVYPVLLYTMHDTLLSICSKLRQAKEKSYTMVSIQLFTKPFLEMASGSHNRIYMR